MHLDPPFLHLSTRIFKNFLRKLVEFLFFIIVINKKSSVKISAGILVTKI